MHTLGGDGVTGASVSTIEGAPPGAWDGILKPEGGGEAEQGGGDCDVPAVATDDSGSSQTGESGE